ncbi:MAG TPA: LamG domain-containing protein [Saprospiraceae bacterium]|nr:LamG domain-containing protein [Saprospiraceae bacterium]
MIAKFSNPLSLNHKGKVIYFVSQKGSDQEGDQLFYNVLSMQIENTGNDENWDGYSAVTFPDEVSLAGWNMLRVKRKVVSTGFFQVVTDQQYIYIIRSGSQSLYVNRYILVEIPNEKVNAATRTELQPAWEVRFKNSGKPDTPGSEKDTQSFINQDGKPFIEPIYELPFGHANKLDLTNGYFTVNFLPTDQSEVLHWQFFIADLVSHQFLSYNIARTDSGWFQFLPGQIDPVTHWIKPDRALDFLLAEKPVRLIGPPSATVYTKQEPVETSDSTVLKLQQTFRLLLVVQLQDEHQKNFVATLDSAISRFGTLSFPEKTGGVPINTIPLGPVNHAPFSLEFNGNGWADLTGDPIVLGKSFTQQAWIYPTSKDPSEKVVLGTANDKIKLETRPPSIWVVDKYKVAVGFGTGTKFLQLTSKSNAFNTNSWNNVLVIFDQGAYKVLINGSVIEMTGDDFSGAVPVATPLDCIGGKTFGSFSGELNEVRIWSSNQEEAAIKYMYTRIPEAVAKSMDTLVAYYPLDEGIGTDIRSITKNQSRQGHLSGSNWVSGSSPLIPVSAPTSYVNEQGLTFYAGAIVPESTGRFSNFGGIKEASRPFLLTSADGYIHLYYQGINDQFLVAQYDTSNSRAHYGIDWEAKGAGDVKNQTGLVVLSSRQTGTAFNHSKIKFSLDPASQLFSIFLDDNQGASENWLGMPGHLNYMLEVLNGNSLNETTDPRLLTGERVFFDYHGKRNQHFEAVGVENQKGLLQLVSRNVEEYIFDSIDVTAGNSPNTCDVNLTVRYRDASSSGTFSKKLKNVSTEVEEFVKTINGSSSVYSYENPDNTEKNGAQFYNIPAGKQSILVILDEDKISGLTIKIEDAEKPNPAKPACNATFTLSMKGSGDILATWKNIPRKSDEFIKAILKGGNNEQKEVAKYLNFYEKTNSLEIQNNEITKPASLYAITSFLDVFKLNATGTIRPFKATGKKIQKVDSGGEVAQLKNGSLLFGVYPNGAPDNGFPATIQKTQSGILLQPGRDGGWIAESPHYSVAIDQPRSGIKITENKISNKALEIPGSLSIESWVNLHAIEGSMALSDISFPRIVHANHKNETDTAQYMLGTTYSTCLKFLQSQPNGPGSIVVTNKDVTDLDKTIFGYDQYSFSFYVKPDRATAGETGGAIYTIIPADANYSTQRLTVKSDGTLLFELLKNNTVHFQKPFNKQLADKVWTQIALTRTGKTITLYHDGNLDNTFEYPEDTPVPFKCELIIGNNETIPFQMEMNQIAIWNRLLMPADVADRYNLSLLPDDEGLILLYRLDSDTKGIKNDAVITSNYYNVGITGHAIWSFPGVFCPAYFAVRNKAVMTSQALLSTAAWNHISGIYSEHYGIELTNQAFGDCGNEDSLNVDTGLTIEAWIIPAQRTYGANQVIFSKYGNDLSEQSYEFGLNGIGRPYLTVKISGRTLNENTKDPAPVNELYFTITGADEIKLNTAYYLAATIDIQSKVLKINEEKSVNEFTLYGQIYVNGRPSGLGYESPKMYGDISINQTSINANIGRTKPDGLAPNQQYYSGKLSDLRLWKTPLSAVAIKSNYEMVTPVLNGDGLISAWYFSEQQGRTAFDNESDNNALLSNRDLWFLYLENSKLQITINGRIVPIEPVALNLLDGYGKSQITIGNMLNDNGGYNNLLNGRIDELRIWSEVRTLEQIKDNKERILTGRENNLAGYWRFQDGSGKIAYDNTGKGNDGEFFKLNPADKLPTWDNSDAPINNEAGIVTNALGGKKTNFSKSIQQGVTVIEYADSQYNYKKELFSIYKRCYIYIDQDQIVQRENNFKIGDLNQVYLGQVQTKPSLIGFIEGAPPIPSENLTLPYYNSATGYLRYSNISTVSLTEAEDTTISFSSSRKDGNSLSFGIKGGFALNDERKVPILSWDLSKIEFKIGVAATTDWATAQTNQSGSSYGLSKLATNKMANSGAWEAKDSDWEKFTKERRFIPDNTGYALVISRTADMYALYLDSTGAMVGFTVIPNLDIPPDKNIIHFPINPKYIKNGTLDGKVGLLTDKDYPNADVQRDSYFKPVEAYSLRRRIEKKEMDLLAYYQQFNAVDRGQSQQDDLSALEANNPIFNFEEGRPRTDLINNYVWTAAGGLYSEKESAMSVRQESHNGSYSIKWSLGLTSEGKFMFGFGAVIGAYYSLSLMGGTDFTINVQKSKSTTNKFALDVAASPEGFLKAFINQKELLYSEEDMPGKVNAYRFMSFYLSPNTQNFDDFFDESKSIVDPSWLNLSDDPMAAALKEAKANPNPAWRILHRVTYVSRVPPEFNPFPLDTNAPPEKEPANLTANDLMIQWVAERLKDEVSIENSVIGTAVRKVINEDLATIIPWWSDFLKAAEVDNSVEQKTLIAFTFDSIEYMTLYYATMYVREKKK